ncbi:hypothetical protein DNU06_06275 [Putridiphycobacter roseus]|uniref:Uncharacterized protein n=1 Tax=Putridiphycobacter roseus TaxID=2219161 RepID=A0A2W1NTY7_9FLAO|nr:hypothetical protein [Putridiphycobacter roseus]PZE18218.1 hypothetical protein DNU06_06275 [Putridiphycobacter roseus]
MRRILLSVIFIALFWMSSCQKCKTCSYTYTYVETVQTVNGEVITDTTLTGYVVDDDGVTFDEECVKSSEEFSIEDAYALEEINTDKQDFVYTCIDS